MEDNRKMPKEPPFVKTNYYPGKLLHASDFVREQEYGSAKFAFMNRKFYGSGIVDGMDVRAGQQGEWYVTAGSALDPDGRFLVLMQDTKINFGTLDGTRGENGGMFVLGVRYAEQVLETERNVFEGEETYPAARVAEGVSFGCYPLHEWREQKERLRRYGERLTERRVLYEDGEIELLLNVPKIIPVDSMFRIRLQVVARSAKAVNIAWRGTVKTAGAYFAESGSSSLEFEKSQGSFYGMFDQEWDVCTEEGRMLPLLLEFGPFEFLREGEGSVRLETIQVPIKTASSYRQEAEKYLLSLADGDFAALGEEGCWVPLACFQETVQEDGRSQFTLAREDGIRFYVYCPQEEESLRRAMEENGIVDIRFRKFQKVPGLFPPKPPLPVPPAPPQPEPLAPPQPRPVPPLPDLPDLEKFSKIFGDEWEKHIRRGVAVIPVPKRYRKGQVLCSEEIPHGFAGEEVFLWCGRLREAEGHVYWERDKKSFFALQGDEELFSGRKNAWNIEKQAVRQNVAEGTFQIAFTLNKGSRRNRVGEVAIAWIAVKSI